MAIKLFIVLGSFYFIYDKIVYNKQLSFGEFVFQIKQVMFSSQETVFVLALFSMVNWFFEVLKWQNLVIAVKRISFSESLEQSLGSLTASLLTPNKIGEYGAKALFFSKGNRKKIVFLNLIANLSQMLVTILFGIIGLWYVLVNYTLEIPVLQFNYWYNWLLLCIVLCGSWWFFFANKTSFFYNKVSNFLKNKTIPLLTKTMLYAIIRYLIFSHQFYYLLTVFGVSQDYNTIMKLIFSMYLIASIVPSLPMFDWVVKGSVAVLVFSLIGIEEKIIISTTLLMWIGNFAIPSIIGSYFVFNFRVAPLKKQ